MARTRPIGLTNRVYLDSATMRRRLLSGLGALATTVVLAMGYPAPPTVPDQSLPPLYLGLDSYAHWDKLPYLEYGTRVGGQSTADPAGTNKDNTNTFGATPEGGRVLLDQAGRGVVTFLRMQQAIGAPWRLEIDGTAPRDIPAAALGTDQSPISYPLSLNPAETSGSSIIASTWPYQSHLRFRSTGPNGNFYSLLRKLPPDVPLPESTAAAPSAAALLRSAGSDVSPAGIDEQTGSVALGTTGTAQIPVVEIPGRRQIRALTFRTRFADKARVGNSRLRIYWDGESTPSVDAPLKFLVGAGAGVYQPIGRQLVQGFPSRAGGDGDTFMEFALYWPMPFLQRARITLAPDDTDTGPVGVQWSVKHQPYTEPANWVGRFHANHTDVPRPPPGQDMTFLDYAGSGKLVGTVLNFGAVGDTLEGDPLFYLDGSRTPQIAVTGTEEWHLGGDYWNNGKQTSLPMGGLPSTTDNPAGSEIDGSAAYRFLIPDSIPFSSRIVVKWGHGATNNSSQRYRATMLWYGTPTAITVPTEEIVPPGGRQYSLTSAYEYTLHPTPITATVTASADSTFTARLRPDNVGAFLRRTFDTCAGTQHAAVSIDGQYAGTWYNPAGAAASKQRCWRDDDLPLPRSLTAGKESVSITITSLAGEWTASEYQLHSFVLGR